MVYGGEVTALLTGQPQRGDAGSAGGCSGKGHRESGQVGAEKRQCEIAAWKPQSFLSP